MLPPRSFTMQGNPGGTIYTDFVVKSLSLAGNRQLQQLRKTPGRRAQRATCHCPSRIRAEPTMTNSRQIKSQPHPESGQSMLELAVCLPVFAASHSRHRRDRQHCMGIRPTQQRRSCRRTVRFTQPRLSASEIPEHRNAAQNEAPKLTITFPTDPAQACSCIDPPQAPQPGPPAARHSPSAPRPTSSSTPSPSRRRLSSGRSSTILSCPPPTRSMRRPRWEL